MKEDNGKNKRESEENNTFVLDDDAGTGAPAEDINETKQFAINGGGKEPAEKCEERGAVRDLTVGYMLWKVLRPLLILLVSAGLVLYLGFLVYHYVDGNYFEPVDASATAYKTVEIKTGSSLSSIASTLYDAGIIRNKFVFQMYVDFNDMSSKLLAGTYSFSPGMTMDEIITLLAKGDGGREVKKITFTEGMTISDMADTLVSSGVFNAQEKAEFLSLCNNADAWKDYDFITALESTADLDGRRYLLEGYLFPDTYEVYMDATPTDVIKKLLSRFDDIFTVAYEDRAKEIGMSVDQVMTLASMIEWEALPKDFKKVSAVFNNRLDQDMPLQSCASLRYVTGKKKFVYTEEERNIDSPYNTYKYAGLPIGPIANPGQKAIEAALNPDTDYIDQGYLYFCTADPKTGDLAFAKTLKEHEANVKQYEDLWQNGD